MPDTNVPEAEIAQNPYTRIDIAKTRRSRMFCWCWKLSISQTAKFMGLTSGPPGSRLLQMGPILAPWALLSRLLHHWLRNCWHLNKSLTFYRRRFQNKFQNGWVEYIASDITIGFLYIDYNPSKLMTRFVCYVVTYMCNTLKDNFDQNTEFIINTFTMCYHEFTYICLDTSDHFSVLSS